VFRARSRLVEYKLLPPENAALGISRRYLLPGNLVGNGRISACPDGFRPKFDGVVAGWSRALIPSGRTVATLGSPISLTCSIPKVMKTSALIAAGALLVGGVGGYVIGSGGQEEVKAPENDRPGRAKRAPAHPGSSVGEAARGGGISAGSLREVLAEPGHTNRIMSLLQYYADLDPSQFESEMQKLQGLPMSQRMLAMNLLFSRWAETDPQGALEQSKTMGFPEMFMARAGVVSGWAASNPEGLAKQYTESPGDFRMGGPGGRGGGDTVGMIAGEWAKQNPEAALKWARTLEGSESGQAISGIFNELAQQDPKAAVTMAAGLSAEERMDAYKSIAESWAISDYSAADRWISGLTGEERSEARLLAVESLANINPSRAAGETLKLPEGEERDELIADVSREWAREDAGAALDWLTTNGGEGAIEEGIGRVVGTLAREDSARAMEYIESQPVGIARDNAVQGYIYGNREAAPADTIRLAETISGEESRQRAVTRVAYQWAREEPAAAIEYVNSSAVIGEESKGRILEMAERAATGEETGGGRGFDRGPRGR